MDATTTSSRWHARLVRVDEVRDAGLLVGYRLSFDDRRAYPLPRGLVAHMAKVPAGVGRSIVDKTLTLRAVADDHVWAATIVEPMLYQVAGFVQRLSRAVVVHRLTVLGLSSGLAERLAYRPGVPARARQLAKDLTWGYTSPPSLDDALGLLGMKAPDRAELVADEDRFDRVERLLAGLEADSNPFAADPGPDPVGGPREDRT